MEIPSDSVVEEVLFPFFLEFLLARLDGLLALDGILLALERVLLALADILLLRRLPFLLLQGL